MSTKKTFKREVAIALIIWLIYLVEVKDVSIVEILVWPIFSFAAAAFGFDAYGKLQQSFKPTDRGRPEHSSQYPGGKRE